jgi:hypothetical protein
VMEKTLRLLLDPNTVARRLRRPLVGDQSLLTDEYLLLHFLNADQRERLEEVLGHPEAYPRIGGDLLALVRNRLRRADREGERPPVEYCIPVPAPLWDRYAQRAREGHRRIDSVLVDALIRDDDRLRQDQHEAIDAREAFRKQAAELSGRLASLQTTLDSHQTRTAPLARELKLEAAFEELGRATAAQGFALACVLRVLYEKGWVAEPLVLALRTRGWLTE